MSTLTQVARPSSTSQAPTSPTPAPLRLPRFLLKQLSQPITSENDAQDLLANIRMADARGLL